MKVAHHNGSDQNLLMPTSPNGHLKRPSLYEGLVTMTPIEVHNDLMRQAKLKGPLLIYRMNKLVEAMFGDGTGHLSGSIDEDSDDDHESPTTNTRSSKSPRELRRKTSETKKELGYNPIFALPIQHINVDIEIGLETAFIEMRVIFINNCEEKIENGIFIFPMINGSVKEVSCCIQDDKLRMEDKDEGKRYIETLLVDSEYLEVDEEEEEKGNGKDNEDMNNKYDAVFNIESDKYISDLFRLPMNSTVIDIDDSVEITIKYEQELEYNEGRYHLIIPLQWDRNDILPNGNNTNLNEIIHINVMLNSLLSSNNIKFGSNSHNLMLQKHNDDKIYLYATPLEHDIVSKDFHIAYYYEVQQLTGCAYIEYEDKAIDGDVGDFILYINPITDNKYLSLHYNQSSYNNHIFGRDIIFLIDRSASMIGASHSKVIQGLSNALDTLSYTHNGDRFGILCFNESQIYFHGVGHTSSPKAVDLNNIKIITEDDEDAYDGENKEDNDDDKPKYNDHNPPSYPLFEATKHYIENAKQFVVNYGPEGGTDIGSPLKWALRTLDEIYDEKRTHSNAVKSIPFVVLVTDGCDYQEMQILKDIERYIKYIRVLTFGIGKYCNPYFLKQLALKSRGWCDIAYYGCDIKPKMEGLLEKCYAPILKDLTIEDGISDNKDIELYPKNIKDIYLRGKPIVICGKYRNNELPQILLQTNNTIRISGISINGQPKTHEFNVNLIRNNNNNNPNMMKFSKSLKNICLRQKLQQLTAEYWMDDEDYMRRKIISISIKENVSSEYVSLVCFKCTETQKYELDKKKKLNIANINTLSIDSEILNIGITNKLFGDANIIDHLSGIYDSIGQFINDDLDDIDKQCSLCLCGNNCCILL